MSALSKLRILELSDGVAGEYCGKLLADFGADVIKVEPPRTGSATRGQGPFGPRGDSLEHSGLFAYLNTNKRSVALDLSNAPARQALHELIGTVDAILDDHPAGYLQELDIDPAGLAARFPGLLICIVTPFGYDAPANLRKAYSLNVLHSSWGYHCPAEADPRQPPLGGAGRFLPDYESGLSAALALVSALHFRESSGTGQLIDVSQQESMASLVDYVLGQMVAGTMQVSSRRQAYDLGGPATFFACRDGYVYLWMSEPAHWNGMWTLMGEPPWMKDYPDRWLELHVTGERIARARAEIAAWMRDQSKCEVATRAQKLGVPLVPVNTMADVYQSAQMRFRGFFTEIEHSRLGRLPYPSVPYRLSATPAAIERAAPLLGEHTQEVLREAAALGARRTRFAAAGSLAPTPEPRRAGPLQGVRVLEVTKIWAGPYTGKLLALLGAEVIRVESYDSLDATRRFGTQDINDAPGFQAINPGKYSVQLSMKTEEGRRLVKELAGVSDIFIENLRPGAAERLGLGYEALRELKGDIVAVSMSMYGHDGPLSYQTGYAPCFSALAGICHLAGYEGGPPVLLNQRYGDSSYGTAAAYAAVVALYHRRRTGQGQYVDVSAVESLSAVLGDAFMEYFMTGRVPGRSERHPDMAPHGCYPCQEQEWISIAVRSDEEWRALCEAMGEPALGQDRRFADRRSRSKSARELDDIVAAFTRGRNARDLAAELQDRRVAAFKSLNSIDLVSDAHLWERGFYDYVSDAREQSTAIVGAPWHFSATPARIDRAAPLLGEHNDYVLGTLLGLSVEERQRLAARKVIY
ncbi:MAG TPA: CoA transferase [Steroidobacteraceae bacterium]|nr:CoA transferase [Steroidobacteraceae bacterium]